MKKLRSESGLATLDFLLGTVLILGTSALVGCLTIALTLSEVLQYVSFSGARAYFAGDISESNQVSAANDQVAVLLKKLPYLNGAIKNGWINVSLGGARNYKDYAESKGVIFDSSRNGDTRNQFVGYQLNVQFPLLGFKIPLMGSVVPSLSDNPVTVTVSSFLMREPSFEECVQFNDKVYEALIGRDGSYAKSQSMTHFRAINDNGC